MFPFSSTKMSIVSFDEYEESKFLRKAKENPFVPIGEPYMCWSSVIYHNTCECGTQQKCQNTASCGDNDDDSNRGVEGMIMVTEMVLEMMVMSVMTDMVVVMMMMMMMLTMLFPQGWPVSLPLWHTDCIRWRAGAIWRCPCTWSTCVWQRRASWWEPWL